MSTDTSHYHCLILLFIGVSFVAADPCLTYEEFQVDYKRSPGYQATVYEESLCDVMVREKWYRFVGEAGGDLTNDRNSVMEQSCGTYSPMWMDGEIPNVAEGIVDRKVCIKSVFDSCHDSFTIQVKNCCSYRVYYLRSASMCPSSYCVSQYNITTEHCTNLSSSTTTTKTSPIGTKTTGTTFRTQNTTTNRPTRPTTAVKLTTPKPTVSTSSGRIQTTPEQTTGDILPDPCLTYEEFQVDYKRSPGYLATVYEESLCDVMVREKWYRFVGEAGGDLTNDRNSVMGQSCGTYNPMWMDGGIPGVTEGIVDRKVCIKSVFSPCHKSFKIKVKNCCSYRVYYLLSANMCPSSYCVSQYNITTEHCTNMSSSTTTIKTSPIGTKTTGTTSRTQKTTTNRPTRPTTAGKLSTPKPTVPTSSGRIQTTPEQTTGDTLPDPCLTYEEFQVDYKRSPGYLATVYEESLCDVMVREKWYRFVGEAGGDLTNDRNSVMGQSCGTYNPMWMDGGIPGVTEGIVDRNVCIKSVFSPCHKSFKIKVKNCCSYRVYYLLSANMCPSAYCVSQYNITTEHCTNMSSSTTTIKTSPIGTKTTGTTSRTQKTTTNRPTRPTTAGKLSTPKPTVPTSSGRIQTTPEQTTGDTLPDPCLTYEEFQVDYKRSPGYLATVYEESLCDVMVREKWYRFVGEAGGDLTNDRNSVMGQSCGTYNPMWMDGGIPGVTEGIVDRNVCIKSVFSPCHKSFKIKVKNCCSYRVYYLLSANMCPSAYCVSQYNITTEHCTNMSSSTTTIKTSPIGTKTTGTTSRTQKTTTNRPTRPTTAGKLSTPKPTVPTSSGRIQTTPEQTTGDTLPDPCLTYEEFQVDYKRSPGYLATVYEESLCDVMVREKWYRFVGEAGGDLTNDRNSVMGQSCGTFNPMWMDGGIPGVAEGIVDRNVCIKSVFSPCHKSFKIKVKNCCSYRVYYLLSANMCPSAYCVSQYNITTKNCSTPTTPPTTTGKLTTPKPTVATSSGRIQTTPEQTTGDTSLALLKSPRRTKQLYGGDVIDIQSIRKNTNGDLIPVVPAVGGILLVVVLATACVVYRRRTEKFGAYNLQK